MCTHNHCKSLVDALTSSNAPITEFYDLVSQY